MKQIIHSLWTLPMISSWRGMNGAKQLLINLYLYTISAWYIKKWEGKIDLYADSLGIWLLEHAPYDGKYLSFEGIDYQTLPCWAAPKMMVMDYIKTPFTHIDGDVLIKSKKMFDLITDDKFDLITEGETSTTKNYFMDWHKHYFINNTDKVKNVSTDNFCVTGVATFNNEELKNKYLTSYFEYRNDIFSNSERIFNSWQYDSFVPDLVIEQCNLYQVSREFKTKGLLNEILSIENADNDKSFSLFKEKCSDEYRHYAGIEKTHMSIEYFRNMLKQLDIELYQKTREKESELRKYLLIENEI